jgi:hypothetical protein
MMLMKILVIFLGVSCYLSTAVPVSFKIYLYVTDITLTIKRHFKAAHIYDIRGVKNHMHKEFTDIRDLNIHQLQNMHFILVFTTIFL